MSKDGREGEISRQNKEKFYANETTLCAAIIVISFIILHIIRAKNDMPITLGFVDCARLYASKVNYLPRVITEICSLMREPRI